MDSSIVDHTKGTPALLRPAPPSPQRRRTTPTHYRGSAHVTTTSTNPQTCHGTATTAGTIVGPSGSHRGTTTQDNQPPSGNSWHTDGRKLETVANHQGTPQRL